jgi:ubiquinone/menaquinone biosynthesis C-methylase UbiE
VVPTAETYVDEFVLDLESLEYHRKQWDRPFQSTWAFHEFLGPMLGESRNVVDLGCGGGAVTAFLAGRHPQVHFLGMDHQQALIDIATERSASGPDNLRFEVDDWFKLRPQSNVDGVYSTQTLSWLPGFEAPIEQIFRKLQPKWIAFSSLFYEGDISLSIKVHEHTKSVPRLFDVYNVYALPAVERFARRHGYAVTRSERFEIDADLPEPATKNSLQTYTIPIRADSQVVERRLQVAGPLLLNWYFVLIEKLRPSVAAREQRIP